MQETQVQSLGQEDPWRREWKPTQVFLPGEFHGQKNLEGYSLWSLKELDRTERLPLLCIYMQRDCLCVCVNACLYVCLGVCCVYLHICLHMSGAHRTH